MANRSLKPSWPGPSHRLALQTQREVAPAVTHRGARPLSVHIHGHQPAQSSPCAFQGTERERVWAMCVRSHAITASEETGWTKCGREKVVFLHRGQQVLLREAWANGEVCLWQTHCPPSFQWICILRQHSSSSAVASLWHQSSMTIWPLFVSVSSADNDHLCTALENPRKDELWETKTNSFAERKWAPVCGNERKIFRAKQKLKIWDMDTLSAPIYLWAAMPVSPIVSHFQTNQLLVFYLQTFNISVRLRGNATKDVQGCNLTETSPLAPQKNT